MGAYNSLSASQFGSRRLDGGDINQQASPLGFNRPSAFKGPDPYGKSTIGVGETDIEHPLPWKSDTSNSFAKAMAWRRHGGSLSYGKTSMGSTFDFSA